MNKYIICKPRAGLIDIISLIVMSLKYAKKFNRLLVIDTRNSLHFRDNFNKYFFYNDKNIYIDDIDKFYINTKNMSLYPNRNSIDYINFDPNIDLNIKINLNEDYNEDIILYGNHNNNLDRDIIYFFNNFQIKPIILDLYKERFNYLPKDYISIHIRNTDYKSNISLFINQNYNFIENKNIFLATDYYNCKEIFEKNFKNIKIYTFTNIVKSDNRYYNRKRGGIHYIIRNNKDHEKFNIDTVIDFLLLASSKQYYFSCDKSGFSKCAKILFDEKNIINNLINNI